MFWIVLIVKYTDCNITADLRPVRHNTAASVSMYSELLLLKTAEI